MPAHTPADLGVALQQARVTQGLSQRDLAVAIGVSQRYIWELEAGKDSPALTRILAAFAHLGVTVRVDVPEPGEHHG
ncbi:MAG: hypothetical protein ABS62_01130 [Microbacterium sp. SCN 70-200]|nr:MAG: hypothetical protein ABS62_01130 [Microbacterium sp. SCN 70-200]OJV84874.1 MAG: hypothetical protein BGO46_04620 [Microbacterium sp. 70-16]